MKISREARVSRDEHSGVYSAADDWISFLEDSGRLRQSAADAGSRDGNPCPDPVRAEGSVFAPLHSFPRALPHDRSFYPLAALMARIPPVSERSHDILCHIGHDALHPGSDKSCLHYSTGNLLRLADRTIRLSQLDRPDRCIGSGGWLRFFDRQDNSTGADDLGILVPEPKAPCRLS